MPSHAAQFSVLFFLATLQPNFLKAESPAPARKELRFLAVSKIVKLNPAGNDQVLFFNDVIGELKSELSEIIASKSKSIEEQLNAMSKFEGDRLKHASTLPDEFKSISVCDLKGENTTGRSVLLSCNDSRIRLEQNVYEK